MKLKVSIYGQRDSRWAGLQLDSSPYFVGDSGCTSVVSAACIKVTPDAFVARMNANGGYTNGGLLIWQKVADLWNCQHTMRIWSDSPADLEWIKAKIRAGYPVVIETRFPGPYSDLERGNISHQHWLVAVSDDFICNDPWFQDEIFFIARYGDLSRWIYSAHVFSIKFDTPSSPSASVSPSASKSASPSVSESPSASASASASVSSSPSPSNEIPEYDPEKFFKLVAIILNNWHWFGAHGWRAMLAELRRILI